jgi:hypothetical protein
MPRKLSIKINEFPQLEEIRDKKKLVEKLQSHINPELANGYHVEDCAITDFNYKPGRFCSMVLKAFIYQHKRRVGEQLYFAELTTRNKAESSRYEHTEQPKNKLLDPMFGPAVLFIPEWNLTMWAFPNDPNLPGLALIEDKETLARQLKASPEKFGFSGTDDTPVSVSTRITKYVPGKRCGVLLSVDLSKNGGVSVPQEYTVYGKAYSTGNGQEAYEIMQQIWESEAVRSGDLLLPQPYSFDKDYRIFWHQAIDGRPLAKTACDVEDLPAISQEIGRRLAAFHNTKLCLKKKQTFEMCLQELKRAVSAISRSFPETSRFVEKLRDQLQEMAGKLNKEITTPLHFSFKLSHIFLTKSGIFFIDFDGAKLGDPGYDIGRFNAHLHKMDVEGKIKPGLAKETMIQFRDAYNNAAVIPLEQERIDWFTAFHLIASQAYKAVKRMNPKSLNKLLTTVDELLSL